MIFERFEAPGLAHSSYIVGCAVNHEVVVVEPQRDVDTYTRRAAEEGWTITHVIETHIPADHASGARELAERTGARLELSGHEEGEHYQYRFPHHDIRDGGQIEVGNIVLEATSPRTSAFARRCWQNRRITALVLGLDAIAKGRG